jgi:hypothetical protein
MNPQPSTTIKGEESKFITSFFGRISKQEFKKKPTTWGRRAWETNESSIITNSVGMGWHMRRESMAEHRRWRHGSNWEFGTQ